MQNDKRRALSSLCSPPFTSPRVSLAPSAALSRGGQPSTSWAPLPPLACPDFRVTVRCAMPVIPNRSGMASGLPPEGWAGRGALQAWGLLGASLSNKEWAGGGLAAAGWAPPRLCPSTERTGQHVGS